ncbi:metalloendopeptidase-like membrane protein [Clostridium sp. CAG:273]|nr:M23 family metallopeptidase [Clostridia bacterium]CDE83049.1 metalloendopeptidase-like membrane protein [Clostridium sp. CAG:273]
MERTITPEERQRRAEEVYNRRRNNSLSKINYTNENIVKEKVNISLFKKMILQILICMVIYVIFYLIKNTSYFFSDDVINKAKEFLKYDINFQNLYNQAVTMLDNNKNSIPFLNNLLQNSNKNETNKEDINYISANEEGNPTNTENVINSNNGNDKNEVKQNNENSNTENAGIGGGKEDNTQVENSKEDKNKSQMEIDAEFLKANYSFINPVKGTVTSRYGAREPTDIISANHYGIDIGASTGTEIIASTDGKVEQVSEEGEYGKHVKIRNGEAVTLYAHCSELLVKEGQQVKQGEKIALVGETGKATGPHLHFEIRRDKNIINPEYILKF